MQPITIALDAMGGDHGPSVVVPAALNAVERIGRLRAVLIGDSGRIEEQLAGRKRTDRIRVLHADEQVEMDEPPGQALRAKRDSSMRVALELVAGKEADACVSAGNTGALLAIARFVLKTLPGIDRPAIISALPSRGGLTRMSSTSARMSIRPRSISSSSRSWGPRW